MIDRKFIGNSAAFSVAALFGASVVATRVAVGLILFLGICGGALGYYLRYSCRNHPHYLFKTSCHRFHKRAIPAEVQRPFQ